MNSLLPHKTDPTGQPSPLERQNVSESTDYVHLHLLCQGIEVTLKGLLILRSYDKHIGQLRRPLGHNLVKISNAAVAEFELDALSAPRLQELNQLNELYRMHLLRYGSSYDILVDPRSIERKLTTRRIWAVVRLTERQLRRQSSDI